MTDPPPMDESEYALLNILRRPPDELSLEDIAALQQFCRFLRRHVERMEQWGNRTVLIVQDLQSLAFPEEDETDGDSLP